MGFLSSLFGSSDSTTSQTHSTVTNTTTTIGDIGLTGQNAVDLAAVMLAGSLGFAEGTTNVLDRLIQQTGEGYQQLIGGASDLMQSANAVYQIETPEEKQKKNLMLLALAAGGVLVFMFVMKR